MIIVDTSVWIEHLRKTDTQLVQLLDKSLVLMHPFIIGELACGNLKDRGNLLSLLAALPAAVTAETGEVLRFIEMHKFMGNGLGYIDMHLLVSAALSSTPIWTRDRRLAACAANLNLSR